MKIQICVKCKQRPASVFITRHDNGKTVNEGLCFQCAAELGIKPPPVAELFKFLGKVFRGLKFLVSRLGDLPDLSLAGENGLAVTFNSGNNSFHNLIFLPR